MRLWLKDPIAVLAGTPPPASTLMIVSGFTRWERKVEVEVIAAAWS